VQKVIIPAPAEPTSGMPSEPINSPTAPPRAHTPRGSRRAAPRSYATSTYPVESWDAARRYRFPTDADSTPELSPDEPATALVLGADHQGHHALRTS